MTHKLCQVHHVAMEEKEVPVRFGLPDRDPAFEEAKLVLFPNAHRSLNGSCEPGFDVDNVVSVCEQCLKDDAEWIEITKN